MMNQTLIINAIISFYILQRVSELFISRTNEKWLIEHNHAHEVNPGDGRMMKIFHISWFIALLVESNFIHELQPSRTAAIICILLGLCLIVRFYSIGKLKQFWTVKVLAMENQTLTTTGLYKYIRHPNYLIVIFEFILIPLLFKAYITMVLFSLINLVVLYRRIKLEEDTLMKQTNYNEVFAHTSKLLPFIMTLFFCFNLHATETNFHFNNYAEAKKSPTFVKFENTSTKLGIITTGFDGYAKDIKITYTLNGDQLTQLETAIPVKSFDTDIDSRNKKMNNDIMDSDTFPQVLITLSQALTLTPGEHTTDMIFTIKDKKITKPVKFTIVKTDGKFSISGSSTLGLKEMELPDPSIFIAKVRDSFDLKFSVTL